jgi:hypothetical protein
MACTVSRHWWQPFDGVVPDTCTCSVDGHTLWWLHLFGPMVVPLVILEGWHFSGGSGTGSLTRCTTKAV